MICAGFFFLFPSVRIGHSGAWPCIPCIQGLSTWFQGIQTSPNLLMSVQLAYKFGELVEVHAADTYAEFVEANEVRPVTGRCSSTASRASTQ